MNMANLEFGNVRELVPPDLFHASVCPSREDVAEFNHERTGLPIAHLDWHMILAPFNW